MYYTALLKLPNLLRNEKKLESRVAQNEKDIEESRTRMKQLAERLMTLDEEGKKLLETEKNASVCSRRTLYKLRSL